MILTFGALFGLVTQHTYEKWHKLGRDAYLTHQSQWFDQKMAIPTSAAAQVIEFVLVACIIGGAYECAAHVATMLITRTVPSQNP